MLSKKSLLVFTVFAASICCQDVFAMTDTISANQCYRKANRYLIKQMRDSADVYLACASEIYIENNCTERFIFMSTLRARNYFSWGKMHQADSLFTKTLNLGRESGVLKWQGYIFTRLGEMYVQKGDYQKALTFYDSASTSYGNQNLTDSPGMADMLSARSVLLVRLGLTRNAEIDLRKALNIFELINKTTDMRYLVSLMRLGEICGSTERNMDALVCFRKVVSLSASFLPKGHSLPTGAMLDMAIVFKNSGKFDSVLMIIKENLKLLQNTPNKSLMARYYLLWGDVQIKRSHFKDALNILDTCLMMAEAVQDVSIWQQAMVQKGHACYGLEEYWKGLQKFHKLLIINNLTTDTSVLIWPIKEPPLLSQGIIFAYIGKIEGLLKLYSRTNDAEYIESAFQGYQAVMRLSDRIPLEINEDRTSLEWMEEISPYFGAFAQIVHEYCQRRNDPSLHEQMFEVMERGKSFVLQSAILRTAALKFGNIPDSLADAERFARASIARESNHIEKIETKRELSSSDSLTLNHAWNNLYKMWDEYRSLVQLLEKKYPSYAQLKYQTQKITLDDLRQKLHQTQEAMLEYFLADSLLVVFVVTSHGSHFSYQVIDSSFYSDLETFSKSLKTLRNKEFLDVSYRLYQKLVMPVEKHLSGIDRLIIIPSAELNYIPFEALIQQPPKIMSGNPDMKDQSYLIRDFEVSYHLSAALWFDTKNSLVEADREGILAVAPVFSKGETLSPDDAEQLSELPYTVQEVESIVRMFRENSRPAQELLFQDATERAFREMANQSASIHLATHSFINDVTPSLSYIAFSRHMDDPENADLDGRLYAGEIYGKEIGADLLVMSSCESGLGKLNRGEGMISLTRAFFYAGCRNIVYSLWPVFDSHTGVFMEHFYREHLHGKSYATALRAAKLAMLEKNETASPFAWSGFVLLGR